MEPNEIFPDEYAEWLNRVGITIHKGNEKWWVDLAGKPIERNVGEMLMLCVSELAEALEGHRKDLMDDHLPWRKMLEVELADALIRLLDMGQGLGMNLGEALVEKCRYNLIRKDHQLDARLRSGGKKY